MELETGVCYKNEQIRVTMVFYYRKPLVIIHFIQKKFKIASYEKKVISIIFFNANSPISIFL